MSFKVGSLRFADFDGKLVALSEQFAVDKIPDLLRRRAVDLLKPNFQRSHVGIFGDRLSENFLGFVFLVQKVIRLCHHQAGAGVAGLFLQVRLQQAQHVAVIP